MIKTLKVYLYLLNIKNNKKKTEIVLRFFINIKIIFYPIFNGEY